MAAEFALGVGYYGTDRHSDNDPEDGRCRYPSAKPLLGCYGGLTVGGKPIRVGSPGCASGNVYAPVCAKKAYPDEANHAGKEELEATTP